MCGIEMQQISERTHSRDKLTLFETLRLSRLCLDCIKQLKQLPNISLHVEMSELGKTDWGSYSETYKKIENKETATRSNSGDRESTCSGETVLES